MLGWRLPMSCVSAEACRIALRLSLLLLFLPLFTRCDDAVFVPDAPTQELTLADQTLRISPLVLDFGYADVGTTHEQALTLENIGDATLSVYGFSIDTNSHFSVEAGVQAGFTLEPGEVRTVDVSFTPLGFEASSSKLIVTSSDPLLPEASVGLAGRCDPPVLELSPLTFSFGNAYLGCSLRQTLYLRNNGGSSLSVPAMTLTGSPYLSLDLAGLSFPLEVAPFSELRLGVSFLPLDEGAHSAKLEVQSTDPTLPLLAGNYSGNGVNPGLIRDLYRVSSNGKVDILFVVDNSGSMLDNQQTLAENFRNFYYIIEDLQLDWQIGVVTTDNAVLQGVTRIITPETADIQETFSTNALVGTAGSGTEMGLEFAYRALSEPYLSSTNRGFLRPDAGLHIIILSDEEDQSRPDYYDPMPRSVDFYISYFFSLKSTPSLVQLSAITGGRTGCNTPCGAADAAQRYAAAVEATGGIQADICACDFVEALETLANESVVVQDTFPLSQSPVVTSLEVDVDGTNRSDWAYDAALNAVRFTDPVFIPQNGEQVQISYLLEDACAD